MIRAISFATNYRALNSASKKTVSSNKQVSFGGIMDNPTSRRVTDANGGTYVIESGGQLVIKNEVKDNKDNMKGALTGAGVGAAGSTVAAKSVNSKNPSSQNTNEEVLKNHEMKTTEVDEENSKDDLSDKKDINKDSDDDTDISETEYDDSDDSGDSIFDDDSPIYVF